MLPHPHGRFVSSGFSVQIRSEPPNKCMKLTSGRGLETARLQLMRGVRRTGWKMGREVKKDAKYYLAGIVGIAEETLKLILRLINQVIGMLLSVWWPVLGDVACYASIHIGLASRHAGRTSGSSIAWHITPLADEIKTRFRLLR